ncbi:MAG: hypothetical protein COA44_09445 [Arcobacter sp.]|nr:MAG: hypothetical protein COA44_09445 [Arcobacter sp.]
MTGVDLFQIIFLSIVVIIGIGGMIMVVRSEKRK